MKQLAIIGAPNCGKTTLFNRLTGARQRTGNWSGVTVERKDGFLKLPSSTIQVTDLPGIYALDSDGASIDAKIANDFLRQGEADWVLVVIDAVHLERQINLAKDISSIGVNIILVVNMLDIADRDGVTLDLIRLKEMTGLPVVGISASQGSGLDELLKVVDQCIHCSGVSNCTTNASHAFADTQKLCASCYQHSGQTSLTEHIDRWVLSPWLAFPFFLMMIYLLFTVSVNLGAVFIDFFDIWLGSWVVDGSRWLLASGNSPEWLTTIVSDGLGGGLQLVCTFIPVIGFLYLFMSIMEDSGYLSRAAFVIDGLMERIGLPGQAFIPLIVGFGCNVPSVMAARSLDRASARLTTVFVAPFMSCGARLSVYVFVGTAMFPDQAENAIFALYLLGIVVACFSAWLLRKSLFVEETNHYVSEMPSYHRPLARNILIQTWQRLYSFMFRAGKRIISVVVVLSVLSSVGTDGTWDNNDSDKSVLAAIGQSITPVFEPMGIGEQNWPATVGLFTGLFAKEVVVGTLDTLYNHDAENDGTEKTHSMPDFFGDLSLALSSVKNNFLSLGVLLTNPLGVEADNLADQASAAQSQGVKRESYQSMIALFPSAWAAFCYLVFILLYAPCVATIGVMQKEAGGVWLKFSMLWSLLLSYWVASNLWQMSKLLETPLYSIFWLLVSSLVLYVTYRVTTRAVRASYAGEIPCVALN